MAASCMPCSRNLQCDERQYSPGHCPRRSAQPRHIRARIAEIAKREETRYASVCQYQHVSTANIGRRSSIFEKHWRMWLYDGIFGLSVASRGSILMKRYFCEKLNLQHIVPILCRKKVTIA